MEIIMSGSPGRDMKVFYRWAAALAAITVLYNIVEGGVSVFFGVEGGTVSLLGFGLDSFVEVISGIGIWHMVRRMRRSSLTNPDTFERTALRVTGSAFYLLSAGLTITALISLIEGHKPETTFWGIVIASVSIASMWALIHYKTKIGRRFSSDALLADAACTRVCMYLSVVLLIASAGYELTGIGGLDSIGAAVIAVLCFREGREAFEKSKGNLLCSCQGKCRSQG